MIRIDPRKWHSQAVVCVYEANTETTGGARGGGKANFIAALTATAALATQIFVLILKDTLYGSLKAVFKALGICQPDSSLWEEWKKSALTTVNYAEAIFLCTTGIASTDYSLYSVSFHVKNQLAKITDLDNQTKELQAKITAFKRSEKQKEFDEIQAELKQLAIFSKNNQSLAAITRLKNSFTVLLERLKKSETDPQPIYDLYQKLSCYYSSEEQRKFDQEMIAISTLMEERNELSKRLKNLDQIYSEKEKEQLERKHRELRKSQEQFYSEVATKPLEWEKCSFADLHQREELLQKVQERLKVLQEMFNEIAHLLSESEKKQHTSWFEMREKGILEQLAKIPQVLQERKQKAFETLEREAYEAKATIEIKYSELCSLMKNAYQNQNEETYLELLQMGKPLLEKIEEAASCLEKAKARLKNVDLESSIVCLKELNIPLVQPELLETFNMLITNPSEGGTLLSLWQEMAKANLITLE